MVERRRTSRPKRTGAPRDPYLVECTRTQGRDACMKGTLADLLAMEPLVFDGNFHPRQATVSVTNADTKPEYET